MELWTALLLGLAGSLHCAGMCGPLALALPMATHGRGSWLAGRLAYNLGRVLTYGALGAIFGIAGQSLVLAGFQRWVSIAAGVAILLGLAVSSRFNAGFPVARMVAWLKSGFARLLKRKTIGSSLGLGLLNGLLPCGLVYAACAGAAATGRLLTGVEYMLVFGAGTVPMMLAVGLAGQKLRFTFRLKLQRLIPASLALVGALLIVRGLALGIPYLSPALGAGAGECLECH